MEVKYIDGNSKLGGRDFDHVLFEMVREKINLTHGKDIRKYKTRRQRDRIRQKCEEVKVALSSHVQQWLVILTNNRI